MSILKKIRLLFITISLTLVSVLASGQETIKHTVASQEYMLNGINQLRAKGCKCKGKRMKPVHALVWSDTLALSALNHAKEMQAHNYFGHHSISGKDIGERLDDIGYNWQFVGENLAEGQKTFDEAMEDWIESYSHCIMLMNKDMKEVAVVKYGDFWVQHFGTLMPPKTHRTKITYTEGL